MLFYVVYAILASDLVGSSDWNYDFDDDEYGPLAWGQIPGFEECAAAKQSPIDINCITELDGFDEFESELEDLDITEDGKTFLTQWDWNARFIHHFKVRNDGRGVKFSPIDAQGNSLSDSNNAIAKLTNMFARESDSPSHFCLDSFHFHWGEHHTDGSEHTQFGVQYPAEIHFVHYSCDYNDLASAVADDTLEDKYVLAVVGFFFEIDDDASDEEISAFEELLQDIENVQNTGDTTNLMNVNLLGSFIPSDMKFVAKEEYRKVNLCDSSLWYYEGSLTTPGCNEIVRWHVFDYKLKITNEILEELRSLSGLDGLITQNWRPVQENENDVYTFEFDCERESSHSFSSSGKFSSSSSRGRHY